MDKTGAIMRTASGTTSYEYRKGAEAGIAVLIHGFAISSIVWDECYGFLADRGYSVLRFDRFGLGGSATAVRDAPHAMELFIAQIKELVDGIAPASRLSLIGLSLGAAIAASFARSYPGSVERLCLIDPGVKEAVPAVTALIRVPGLGPLLFKAIAKPVILANLRKALPSGIGEAFLRECMDEIRSSGYLKALGSALAHCLLSPGAIDYSGLPPELPVTLVWGTADAVMPIGFSESVRRSLGHCDFRRIPGAGHCPPMERAHEVNSILLEFMGSGSINRGGTGTAGGDRR